MPRSKSHLAHVTQLQPVFGDFLQLFVDQRVASTRPIVSLHDPQVRDLRRRRKASQIHQRLLCDAYRLEFSCVIDRQALFVGEVDAWGPAMSFAMPDVIIDSLRKQLIRSYRVAASQRNGTARCIGHKALTTSNK